MATEGLLFPPERRFYRTPQISTQAYFFTF